MGVYAARVRPWTVLIIDLVAVALFILGGQRNHLELLSVPGYLHTLWPFALALLLGTGLAARWWRRPGSTAALVPGVIVWLVTWAGGLLLRVGLTDDTARTPFVILSGLLLAALLLGWRTIALVARRVSDRRTIRI